MKVSRLRNEHPEEKARNLSRDKALVACENLKVKNAAWCTFCQRPEYFALKFNCEVVGVPPYYTSQKCSNCDAIVKKSLFTRTHRCSCGCQLQ
ncbi:zinc ribbon domain-containing protein [Umezakia ovalisporum]|uniref:Transposase n=2 Tax=Umezakia ovalisporum TaxID=75695 RepID=A0AA43KDT4_9CYAN|nr:zinc ribbon domain-containing protein [Umezakia ovalisporum]MDH6056392.1 transposase [Umezakia ovalisporum FSS-43]MDH6062218.1 transposase [Umezakia ovalisporum FSS-62]MDH6068092.1 transposase [Umezakia ovalisporum APH033B]MDH6072728.1 transposase [Umezakia ovalisporum CobakiLakeA]MDH6075704.1 transposase [Umezakia ovalisporum CS-1034]